MAVLASSGLLPGLKSRVRGRFLDKSYCEMHFSQIKLFGHHPHRRSRRFFLHRSNHPALRIRSMNGEMAQFGEPNRAQDQPSGVAKERLWQTIQEPVKMFPWDKAADKMQERLLSFGHKALKWSLLALLTVSSLSDAVYSISRNQELMIPSGLFVGCLFADFLKEISEESFRGVNKGSNWQLLAVGCVFLLFKLISLRFALGIGVFLLHVGNGGLMQSFWLWRNLVKVNGTGGDESETSSAVGTQNYV